MSANDDPTELGITEADRRRMGELVEQSREHAQRARQSRETHIPPATDPRVRHVRSLLRRWPDEHGSAHVSARDVARETRYTPRVAGWLLSRLERDGELEIASDSGHVRTYHIQL